MSKIKPELPGGFRDYLPKGQSRRSSLLDALERLASRYGFLPLDTSRVEKKEILTGGDPEFEKELIEIDRSSEKEDWALRFDLTVPLSRVVASNPQELVMPFKRYQWGKVWRGEKPQAGRYREFTQFDIDIVSAPSMAAEAEIISFISEFLGEVGVENFSVLINNRKVLEGLPILAGFENEKTPAVLRSIDKLDKFGWSEVEGELADLGLDSSQVSEIRSFVGLKGEGVDLLNKVEDLMEDSETAKKGVDELKELIDLLGVYGVDSDRFEIDLSIARGLDYYTGTVFETVLDESDLGSVFSGGRYDGLIEKFSSSPIPAVGASLGVDRFLDSLKDLGIEGEKNRPDVLVLNFDEDCKRDCLGFVRDLRKESISTELYLGQEENLKGQLSYGAKRNFKSLVIYGSQEKERGVVQIKDMDEETQEEVEVDDFVAEVKKVLS